MSRNFGLVALAFGIVALACCLSAAQGQEKTPVATGLGLVGSGGSSTTRPPTVAVSDSGIIYVLWNRPYQSNAPAPEGVARLPKEFAPKKDGWVPAIAACRNGRWSNPGLLVESEGERRPRV